MKTKKALERSLKLSDYSLSEEKVPEACKSPYTGQSTPRNTRYIQENEGTTGGCQRATNNEKKNPHAYQKNFFHSFLLFRFILHCVFMKEPHLSCCDDLSWSRRFINILGFLEELAASSDRPLPNQRTARIKPPKKTMIETAMTV